MIRRIASDTADTADTEAPSASFTLGSALAWLGHDCPDGCSAALDSTMATIWFVRQSTGRTADADRALITLDLTDVVEPAVRIRRLLRDVNSCVAADRIRVVGRPSADNPRALASVPDPVPRPDQFARELEEREREIEHLQAALQNARRIGAAVGILMAIHKIHSDEAFDRLSKASQNLNRKLRDVADEVVRTGALPDHGRVAHQSRHDLAYGGQTGPAAAQP